MERCYAVAVMQSGGRPAIFAATEGHGACRCYTWPGLECTTVWDGPGGTMSMVPLPGSQNSFLAVQQFFPTFQSENAVIVRVTPGPDKSWQVEPFVDLPYVHRFDVLSVGDCHYFLGATLCTSKANKEDWSDPGKIYVGRIPNDPAQPLPPLQVLKTGLTKNHGYCRVSWRGRTAGMVTCEEGVFALTPPQHASGAWQAEQVLAEPTSDIALVDIDGDGEDELVTIAPFHGQSFRILKQRGGRYEEIYEYGGDMAFGHVVWGGLLRGKPAILGGYRRNDKALFCVQPTVSGSGFETTIIDTGVGPSNIAVMQGRDCDVIVSANRELGETAIYRVFN